MTGQRLRLAAYSAAHCAVDFSCALLIYRCVGSASDPAALFLLYNYCAFALQMPFGLLADRWNRNACMAALGCGLTAAAFALSSLPMAAAAVCGVGNALFHVGGGVDVLNDSNGRASSLGVYVSPGALGLYFGAQLGKGSLFPELPAVLLLGACALLIYTAARRHALWQRSGNAPLSLAGLGKAQALLPALCLFMVVALRSYAGMTAQLPWKGEGAWGIAALLSVVLGKTAGGFAMDRFGAKPAALLSLGAAGLLFLLGDNPFAGTAALFLFNMSMPITLSALSSRMPGAKGFSFGLLTFALFLGFAPVGLGAAGASPYWLLAALCALSALLCLPGLARRKEAAHA